MPSSNYVSFLNLFNLSISKLDNCVALLYRTEYIKLFLLPQEN